MAVYRLWRIPLLMALFILVMIQGIESFPRNIDFIFPGNDYESSISETQSRIQNSKSDGELSSQRKLLNHGADRHDNTETEGKIFHPSSSDLNSDYILSNPGSSVSSQRPKLDWDIQNRRKLLDRKKRPVDRGGSTDSDSRIVFPSDEIEQPTEKISSGVPVCHGKTFCENVPYYPEDLLKNAIKKTGEIQFLSGNDVVSDVVQRIDLSDIVPLCITEEQVIYPKSAESQNKEWLYVVNHGNLTQGVRIETCSNEDGECSVIEGGVAEGYRTICKQKYIYRQLAAITENGIKQEMFQFPSSCCCHIKFLGHPLSRMGTSLGKTNFTPVPKKTRKK